MLPANSVDESMPGGLIFMSAANPLTVISLTKDARLALKRIQRILYPSFTDIHRITYSDTIFELERRLESGELSERPTADVA